MKQHNTKTGFALLMTIIVVSVLISIGLVVLDLSVKQLRLSTNAKESETAFHAANAGMECARYVRRTASSSMESGTAISPSCFSVSPDSGFNTVRQITSGVSGSGSVYLYEYRFTWANSSRCTKVQTLVAAATPLGSGLTISNMTNLIPGYLTGSTKTCAAGERCTVISTRGYNRACSTASGYGSVEREVLLQF